MKSAQYQEFQQNQQQNMNDFFGKLSSLNPNIISKFEPRSVGSYLQYILFEKPRQQGLIQLIVKLHYAITYVFYLYQYVTETDATNPYKILLGNFILQFIGFRLVKYVNDKYDSQISHKFARSFYDYAYSIIYEYDQIYISGALSDSRILENKYLKMIQNKIMSLQKEKIGSTLQNIFPVIGVLITLIGDQTPSIQSCIQMFNGSQQLFALFDKFNQQSTDQDNYETNLQIELYLNEQMKKQRFQNIQIESKGGELYHIKNLNCRILKNINLTVKKGDKIALIGKNGHGKTTLLNVLGKIIDEYDDNIVFYHGQDIKYIRSGEYFSQVQVVQQKQQLIYDSIYNNITLGLTYNEGIKKIKKDRYYKQICKYLKAFQLEKLIDQLHLNPHELKLSGGQKQIICIIRAIIRQPKVLLLDEFTTYLDVTKQEKIFEIMSKMKDLTVVCVTHIQDEMKWFNRVVEMEDGRITQN